MIIELEEFRRSDPELFETMLAEFLGETRAQSSEPTADEPIPE